MAGERVLIVDDTQANLQLARYLLEADGFDVRTAETADEMVTALTLSRPQVILMDLRLRGIDGISLIRQLRSDPANGTIAIVAFSAEVRRSDEERLRDVGCDGYITKPIDVTQFCAGVRRYLGCRPVPQ
jgi:two-component system cell cycle response regulator DivK